MADFSVRSDSVDVEQIMRQIRARIREKRGADYTEAELRELANVKLEKFLDPRGLRSDLVEQFRRQRSVSPEPPKFVFEDSTMYETHRGFLRFTRKLLHPILKLFINPNPLIHALHVQAQVNEEFHKRFRQREEMDPLYYEVVHNLVVEITRLGIEVQNLKMRVESLSSRMDFDERRARSLEGAVEYRRDALPRPSGPQAHPQPTAGSQPQQTQQAPQTQQGGRPNGPRPEGDGERRRRRRRRRRRPGQTMGDQMGSSSGGTMPGQTSPSSSSNPSPERNEGAASSDSLGPMGPADEYDDGESDQ